MMVQQFLSDSCVLYPDSVAILHEEKKTTFSELDRLSDSLAAYLQENWDVVRNQHICILYENCREYIICYFAILKAGATVVSLNSAENPEKLREMIRHSESRGLLGSRIIWNRIMENAEIPNTLDFAMDYRESVLMLENRQPVVSECSIRDNTKPTDPHGIDLDLAEIVYTSGSTANPKGVMLSHLNLCTNMVSIQDYFKLNTDDSVLVVLPLSYIFGKSLLLTHIMVGGKVIIDNRFTYPSVVLESIVKEQATGFAGVPSTYSLLLAKTAIAQTDLPHLKYVAQAGGSMAPALQKEVIEAISPAQLFVMYGATEAAPRLTWLPPDKLETKIGSIGIPLLNVEMAIRGNDGSLLSADEEGELAARGSNIMRGYWKDQENTDRVLQDGYYLTGDIGYRDKDGFYFITGRNSDFMKVKGFRISCKEVEECILEIQEVEEAAVIGVSDRVFGEAIRAYIVPVISDNEDFQTKVANHIRQRIGPIKIPQQWEYRKSLPKNSSGKIMKEVLKKELK